MLEWNELGIATSPDPSASATNSWVHSSKQERRKTIRVPSGDHAPRDATPVVICVLPLPSAFITQSWPPRRNISLVPSGDQAGPDSLVELLLRFVSPVPSGLIT